MPPNKKQSMPMKDMKQQTLTGLVTSSSSPYSSPARVRHPTTPRSSRTTTRAGSAKRRRGNKLSHLSSEDDDESSNDDVAAIRFEPGIVELSEDESPRKPHRSTQKSRAQRAISSDEERVLVSHDSPHDSSDDRPLGKRKAKNQIVEISDSSDDDDPPRRRKLIKGARPSSPEDEDDIFDEVDKDKIIESRFRTRGKKTAFQRNLEKLKKKKRGEATSPSQSEDASEDDIPFAEAKPHKENNSDISSDEDSDDERDGDQEEDSFIVEDDGAARTQLPMMFSMNTHQDLSHHFKVICQLFVHMAVTPPDERRAFIDQVMQSDEYFSVALHIARRKISGLRDTVASSVWRPDFKKPLETYPELQVEELDFAVPACDACHLGGRMSTRLARLLGIPYDSVTYGPLNDGSDGSDSGSNSSVDVDDSDNEKINDRNKSIAKEFHLGRFCAARTHVFHKLVHWEYALFTSLSDQINEARHNKTGYVRVAHAHGRKPPKDPTDADGYMDWLDQRGVIETEWQHVKEMMERANHLEVMVKSGDNNMD